MAAEYLSASRELGRLLVEGNHVCLNGGGRSGCMGAINEEMTSRGGQVIGAIHRMWIVDGAEAGGIELRIADGPDLHHRKQLLYEGADCFVVLPGGVGTWDELWEVATERALGLRQTPIVLISTDGYYDGFITQMERAWQDKILKLHPSDIVHVCETPEQALEFCLRAVSSPDIIAAVPTRLCDPKRAPEPTPSQSVHVSTPLRSCPMNSFAGGFFGGITATLVAGVVLTSLLAKVSRTR